MNRSLLIVLGVLAAVILAAVVVIPLVYFGGDDEVEEDPAEVAREARERELEREEERELEDELEEDLEELEELEDELDELEEDAPETFEVFTARDPFEQLVVDEPEPIAPDPDDPDPLDPDPDDPDPLDPPDPVDPDNDNDDPVITPGDPDDPDDDVTVNGTTIELEEIYDDDGTPTAQVTVNRRGYDVTEGQDFAQTLRLLSIDDPCVELRYRDRRGEDLRFTLCEGETIRK